MWLFIFHVSIGNDIATSQVNTHEVYCIGSDTAVCDSQQDAVKGSQGAGRVDESLDISKQAVSDGPKLPPGKGSRSTAGGGRKKGRR